MTYLNSVFIALLLFAGCSVETKEDQQEEKAAEQKEKPERLIVIGGAITETVCALGYGDRIIATDVTSNYPEEVEKLPSVGHPRQMTAEGLLSERPDKIILGKGQVQDDLLRQLQKADVQVIEVHQPESVEGTKKMIREVAALFDADGSSMIEELEQDIFELEEFKQSKQPGVLFLYARGADMLLAAGTDTPADAMISLVGARNVAAELDGFKPLSPEALVQMNPDALLLFSSGLESIQDENESTLQLPGISKTNAGKNKHFIAMDGNYLLGFGPRVGKAAKEVAEQLYIDNE